MKRTIVHPEVGEVTLSATRRSRRISLTVRPSGEVRLSYPIAIPTKKALEFLEQKREWVIRSKARYAAQRADTPHISAERREELRAEAKAYLPARVAEIANACGLSYGRVTIRATRSKWGSCTWQNNISLSLYLMLLPRHLIDYVIIHELCHTRHHNHSEAFHAMVNSMVGSRERELRGELRRYTINI